MDRFDLALELPTDLVSCLLLSIFAIVLAVWSHVLIVHPVNGLRCKQQGKDPCCGPVHL